MPDDLVVRVVKSWLSHHQDEFVFDGFPRSGGQADALEAMLAPAVTIWKSSSRSRSAKTLTARVAGRLVCADCGAIVGVGLHVAGPAEPCPRCGGALVRRADDNPETLATRLREYHEKTEPLLGYYEKRGLLRRIDSSRTPEEVFASVRTALEEP